MRENIERQKERKKKDEGKPEKTRPIAISRVRALTQQQ